MGGPLYLLERFVDFGPVLVRSGPVMQLTNSLMKSKVAETKIMNFSHSDISGGIDVFNKYLSNSDILGGGSELTKSANSGIGDGNDVINKFSHSEI